MSNHRFFLRWMSLPLATVLGVAAATAVQPQALGGEAARLDGFTQDGNNVFALSMKPSVAAANGPRDVVVLISTAASQTGDYRTRSLATLQAFLSSLGAGNRVELIAFDLNAVTLTQGFVAPNSAAMAAGVEALNRRTPLGSCDLQKALETAIKSFSGSNKLPRVIVYIGDGSSRANILTADAIDGLVNELIAQRTPVIAFGVGPHIQEQMLGILASRSGGIVVPEQANVDVGAYGTGLAYAAEGSVYWPKAGPMKWPEGMEVYPRNLPPFRSDRDTTVIGVTKSTAAGHVDVEVDGPAGQQKLSFDIPAFKSDPENAYLVSLLDQAKIDGGRTLPLIDSASLANAKKEIAAGAGGLSNLARKALEDGNLSNADELASAALKRNPKDLVAQAVKDTIAKKANGAAAPAGPAVAVNGPAAPAAAEKGDLNLQGGNVAAPAEGAAAAADINQATALEERWQKDVQNTINKARGQVTVDPTAAEAMVQNKTNDLTAETELRPEVRDRLMGMLHAAAREIKHRREEFVFREQQRIHEEMARREQEMTNEAFLQDQTKVKQLMDRYDSLIAEGRHRLAEESAAFEATKIINRSQPDAQPLARVAAETSRLLGTYTDIMATRVAKEKGFVDAMYTVEKSQVPTADDPPIVYPDAETWKELTARRKEKYSATELSRRSPTEKKIEEALKQPTQIEFVETPLKDVVDYLKDLHHIEIQLDGPALKEAGVDESTPVTKNLKGISLRSALKLLLDELQLKYVVHNEVLLITSPAKAESDEYMTTKVYPVADLVLPIKDAGFAGGFGGMGGMGGFGGQGGQGGAFGGNGAGFGGGMMGGMGGGGMMGGGMGGMGGMGMGMGGGMGGMGGMGGGMFNVPREILPASRQPVKLFAVEPESVSKEPAAAGPVRSPDAVPAIKLNLAPGADVNAAWEDFFAKHEPEKDSAKLKGMSPDELKAYQARLLEQQMSVLKTVQELKDAAAAALNRGKRDEVTKAHQEIAAVIQAALRHDQAQPWMYEILAMSMKAAGQSQDEIDRAIMSAAEFTQSSTDLMYLGAFLVQSKMDRRALQIFRQVSRAEPLWPEPYFSGMLAARRLQDVAGLEWSTAGIIGQAWSPAQAHIWEDAYRVAQATLKDLRDNKRDEEADHFQAVLNDAMTRDCVVKVQWTGDADIDLMVKEPAGTVCSLRNQRTTGGGVMIGDMSSESAASVEGHVAVYTCPKAFSGGYQILLRRVFGKLTTGKVTVEVITHLNTPMVKSLKQVIPLGKSEALVKFDVADGRRKESIQEQQVVNAAVAAVAQRNVQNILAQQLANLNDPAAANALGAAQQAAASSSAGQSQQLNPLAFPTIWPGGIRGAVGYQPVIITLPTGTNLAATAVVSADRRYVRITSVPLFSAVSNVTTFNIADGTTQNTTGAYGGGAGGGLGSNPGNNLVGGAGGGAGGGVF